MSKRTLKPDALARLASLSEKLQKLQPAPVVDDATGRWLEGGVWTSADAEPAQKTTQR